MTHFLVLEISNLQNKLFRLKFFTKIPQFDRLLNPTLKIIVLARHNGDIQEFNLRESRICIVNNMQYFVHSVIVF